MIHSFFYFCVQLKKVFYRLWLPIIYRDKKKCKQRIKQRITQAEKRYLRRYLYAIDSSKNKIKHTTEKIVWICWLQGEENMPDVVRICVASICQHLQEYNVVILSDENISSYVQFPPYIYRLRKDKKISATHFSDLLRVTLLEKYGGIWVDATVYMTASLPEEISKADFFAYHTHSYVSNNNWLLKANAGDILMRNMRNLLLEYWKNEGRLLDYFIYHILFDMLIEEDETCHRLWEKTPVLYDDCYELERNFFNKYDEKLWCKISLDTSIHKLSWKYKGTPKEDNFLGMLLTDKLKDEVQ